VVLAGARGHGRWHLENIRRLAELGVVRLAGICELKPLDEAELEGLTDPARPPAQSADFGGLLDITGARVAVLCTPLHTHTDLALVAAERGVHVLLEKPPAPSYAEFARMAEGVRSAGVVCQIGFQSLGSHALPAVRQLVADGAIGELRGVGAAGAWARDTAYFTRAAWSGRRRLNGADVVDGALTNPLAHAVATALALATSARAQDVTSIETELFRAHDIESDDTSCVRISTERGVPVTVAATLCAGEPSAPYVVLHGSEGRITLWYTEDRVRVERAGDAAQETSYDRSDLLENLVAHLTRGEPLLVPPESTGAFMRVVEAVRLAPDPVALPASAWRTGQDRAAPRRIVDGVEALVAASAETLSLYSELGAPWARPDDRFDRDELSVKSSDSSLILRSSGRAVARYLFRPDVASGLSPRPYLHPVCTLSGRRVTEELPADHPHHLGVGVAVPDVNGISFWGGSTYVRDQGPRYLDNHGVQVHRGWQRREPGGFAAELSWRIDGEPGAEELIREHRTVTALELDSHAWALDFVFALTNSTDRALSIGSPATNGRPGAGYGGFFWRAPKEAAAPETFTAGANGEDAVHGSPADWVAVAGGDEGAGQGWTLAFAGATEATRRDPWFVRTSEYPGVGSSLAWSERLPLESGETMVRRIVTVVADGRPDRDAVASYVSKAVAAATAHTPDSPGLVPGEPKSD
jgi:predicted dehydrogenase